jgi:hypothetical protein
MSQAAESRLAALFATFAARHMAAIYQATEQARPFSWI